MVDSDLLVKKKQLKFLKAEKLITGSKTSCYGLICSWTPICYLVLVAIGMYVFSPELSYVFEC
jgi:hypothetical protein